MKKLSIALLALTFAFSTPFAARAQSTGHMGDSQTKTDSQQMNTSTGAQHATLSDKDMKFLRDAAKDNAFEIQASQIAAQKATDPNVKQFAEKLVNEHTQLSQDLSKLASSKGVTLPEAQLEKGDLKKLDKLNKASGDRFDKLYVKYMAKDHRDDIKDFKSEAKKGKDPDLEQWASNHISALQQHLDMAQNLENQGK
jgi:putative membrane protein